MFKSPFVHALALAVTLTAANAVADATERVTLRDGSVYAGEIVEKVPGDHITLKLATGEIKRFEWAMIAEQPPAPAAPPPRPSAPPRPDTVHVSVESTKDETELLKIEGTGEMAISTSRGMAYGVFEQYSTVCTAPCQADVDPNGRYKIGGRVTPSGSFSVAGRSSPLRIDVDAGSRGMRTGGLIMLIGGASMLPVGIVMIALGFALPTETYDQNFNVVSSSPNSTFLTMGAVFGVAGLVLLGAGIPMFIAGKTHVTVNDEPVGLRLSPSVALTPRGLVF